MPKIYCSVIIPGCFKLEDGRVEGNKMQTKRNDINVTEERQRT